MKMFKDCQTALSSAKAISSLARRYLVEVHSSKAKDSRFIVTGDLQSIPFKQWDILKVIQPVS